MTRPHPPKWAPAQAACPQAYDASPSQSHWSQNWHQPVGSACAGDILINFINHNSQILLTRSASTFTHLLLDVLGECNLQLFIREVWCPAPWLERFTCQRRVWDIQNVAYCKEMKGVWLDQTQTESACQHDAAVWSANANSYIQRGATEWYGP